MDGVSELEVGARRLDRPSWPHLRLRPALVNEELNELLALGASAWLVWVKLNPLVDGVRGCGLEHGGNRQAQERNDREGQEDGQHREK